MRRTTAATHRTLFFVFSTVGFYCTARNESVNESFSSPFVGASFVPSRSRAGVPSRQCRPRWTKGCSSWKHHRRRSFCGTNAVPDMDESSMEHPSNAVDLGVSANDVDDEEEREWSEFDEAEIQQDMMKMLLPANASLNETDGLLPVYNISMENIDLLPESSNIAYFYLQNEVGLSETALWKVTYEAGSALGMTAKTLRKKVELLRRTMDLTDEDIRTIIERQPTILHLSADKNIAPKVLFYVRALDMSKEDLRTIVVQIPSVLTYSMATLKEKLNFFTKLMGYTPEELRGMILTEPKLLTAGVRTGLMPRFQFLIKEMMIPVEKLRTIVQKNPRIMLYSLDENLRPKLIFYFIMTCHMEPHHVLQLLLKYPQIVDYNLENHVLPITRYFVSVLEFSALEFRNILLKFPRLVTHSLDKIKHVVGYLRYELGMKPEQVKRVLYQAPQAVGLNTDENLKSKVEFLREELALTNEQLRVLLAGMPTLIICGIDSNLRPKMEYLREVFDSNMDEVRQTVLTLPTLLGYSLEKRIQPRMERLLEVGGHPGGITIGIPMKEENFDSWLQARKIRLEKDPGFDIAQRKKKRGSSADSLEAATPVIPPPMIQEKRPSEDERKGRVVHWTRRLPASTE